MSKSWFRYQGYDGREHFANLDHVENVSFTEDYSRASLTYPDAPNGEERFITVEGADAKHLRAILNHLEIKFRD
jgi:hypothetical protein